MGMKYLYLLALTLGLLNSCFTRDPLYKANTKIFMLPMDTKDVPSHFGILQDDAGNDLGYIDIANLVSINNNITKEAIENDDKLNETASHYRLFYQGFMAYIVQDMQKKSDKHPLWQLVGAKAEEGGFDCSECIFVTDKFELGPGDQEGSDPADTTEAEE